MDAQLKANWVKALRSGKYEQCQIELTNDGKYCCLGVLCIVAEKPLEGSTYAWLDRITGDYSPFVTMNDDDGKTFPEIADYIEQNL